MEGIVTTYLLESWVSVVVEAARYEEYEDGEGQERRVSEAGSGRDELDIETLPPTCCLKIWMQDGLFKN